MPLPSDVSVINDGYEPLSNLYSSSCFFASMRSDCWVVPIVFCDIPEYATIVIAARMPNTIITTRSSTIVKAFWSLGFGKWVLGLVIEEKLELKEIRLKWFFSLLRDFL